MKKILIFFISTAISGSVYSADDIFKKDKSLLILDNDEPHYEIESGEQVDFFESFKQQEQDRINQRNYDLAQQQQIQSNTSNMSPHDKSQYLLEHRHFDALNAQGYEQQFNSILKAKNKGLISEQDYQQRIVRQSPLPSGQRTNQLRFSIPIGE
ncbi:hypothetical protein F909_02256 [Acinetobacter sp. ANC 3929]|uniref:hypothetical protein n=1 Tax=unclassified Acinetobacter TaxID=196816 RepID=UPI0002D02FF7|nr:hypothetical protein [Acinetobacter sp. ANC 3929]ENW80966.1 hypothetical protein F909_02256 [Acinetobacter sp. ANC 3929]MCH7351452.1 hypothetical protein [Acinetobacter sp. NIPH 2023]MCH7355492.1 hypothetical protein [Acinetobacter sp. NIPH 1958]MCH7358013.1 hypothetical protein [Acinetobacter sp. NIPH 2024]